MANESCLSETYDWLEQFPEFCEGCENYDLEDRKAIRHSIRLRPGVSFDELMVKVERSANLIQSLRDDAENYQQLTPDEIRREFTSLHGWITKYLADISVTRPDRACRRRKPRRRGAIERRLKKILKNSELRGTLVSAADRVADREWWLPDLPGDIYEQADMALQSIQGTAWLNRVALDVINRELLPAGNRGNVAHTVALSRLTTVYRWAAADSRELTGEITGELLDFIANCLFPIGDKRECPALHDALRRLAPYFFEGPREFDCHGRWRRKRPEFEYDRLYRAEAARVRAVIAREGKGSPAALRALEEAATRLREARAPEMDGD